MSRSRPHVAGLILARGGSQGIPLKNLALLRGRPLLEWALGSMINFGNFDSLWVSTDHPGIATCASAFGVQVFARSSKFACSEAASVDAVNEFLLSHPEVDVVALVQCTSPFIRPGKSHGFFPVSTTTECNSEDYLRTLRCYTLYEQHFLSKHRACQCSKFRPSDYRCRRS